MIGRQRRKRLSGILQLHRMALLRTKIDGCLAEEKVVRDDDAIPPAFVLHKCARCELG
jgi:hypothetical protein